MPLALLTYPNPKCILALWNITEDKETLSNLLSPKLADAELQTRHRQSGALQFLAARALCSTLFPDKDILLQKTPTSKPSLIVNQLPYHLSISHSFELAGILVSQEIPLAIDIEKKDRRIGIVKNKFMHPDELSFAGTEEQTAEQILIWSAKESLYKRDGEKSLDFREHLRIDPFTAETEGCLSGKLFRNNHWIEHKIQYFTFGNFYITYIAEHE